MFWPNDTENHQLGVANGPSKTMGLPKCSRNFTGLAVSFFSGYVRLAVSIFFKAKKSRKVLICLFLFFSKVKWHHNILDPERLEFAFKTL